MSSVDVYGGGLMLHHYNIGFANHELLNFVALSMSLNSILFCIKSEIKYQKGGKLTGYYCD